MYIALRLVLATFMVFAGVMHFRAPGPFVGIVPKWLPRPLFIVHASGVIEIALGLGLLVPALERLAAWGLVVLFIAVFPANVNMAVNRLPFGRSVMPPWMAWARLPLQAVFVGWAYWLATAQASQ